MKKHTYLIFLLLFAYSCKKDTTYLTQGQLTALRLESDLGVTENTVSTKYTVAVFNLATSSLVSLGGTNIKITNDGFIIISGTNFTTVSFNLGQLKSYQLVPTNNLDLYF